MEETHPAWTPETTPDTIPHYSNGDGCRSCLRVVDRAEAARKVYHASAVAWTRHPRRGSPVHHLPARKHQHRFLGVQEGDDERRGLEVGEAAGHHRLPRGLRQPLHEVWRRDLSLPQLHPLQRALREECVVGRHVLRPRRPHLCAHGRRRCRYGPHLLAVVPPFQQRIQEKVQLKELAVIRPLEELLRQQR